MRHGFVSTTRKQVPKPSVEVSDIIKAEESKTVKVKSQDHVNHVLQCEGYRVLATGPDDQSANWQGDPVAYA